MQNTINITDTNFYSVSKNILLYKDFLLKKSFIIIYVENVWQNNLSKFYFKNNL